MTSIYRSEVGAQAIQSEYARLLEQWPAPHKRLTVPTTHGDTFVVACGPEAGPPLILLQGSGANAALWTREVATWATHFRVYAIDMIGEPGFSAPSRPPLSPVTYSAWLEEVLSGLQLTRVSITGGLAGWVGGPELCHTALGARGSARTTVPRRYRPSASVAAAQVAAPAVPGSLGSSEGDGIRRGSKRRSRTEPGAGTRQDAHAHRKILQAAARQGTNIQGP
jgi:hypothetical protein